MTAPETQTGPSSPRYTLPLVALVLSVLGICFCPLALVGIVLGIMALVRISKEPGLPGQGLAIAALVIPVGLVPVVGVMAAIAIPNFIKYQARAKQSECKTALRQLYTAQSALFAEQERYTEDVSELGFSPPPRARYAYLLSAQSPGTHELPEGLVDSLGVHGACPDCTVTLACVGQIDSDETVDVWTISSEPRMTQAGGQVPAGTPHNDVNDVSE